MHEARRNLLVGLFVLVGLSVLGVLIVLFGRGPTQFLGSPGYPLNIHFERIAGIRPGNDVTIGGIRIGRVSDVGFFDPQQLEAGANVKVMIEQDFRLPNGSRAVTNEPVLGQGRPPIEIVPGPPGMSPLEPGAVIPGELRGAVDAIVPEDIRAMFYKTTAQVGETADKLTPVLEDLHKILTWREPADVDRPGGPSGNLASAMVRLDGAVKHFNEVLGDPAVKSHLRGAVENFHQISEDGRVLAESLRRSSDDLEQGVKEARGLVSDTRRAVTRIEGELTDTTRSLRSTLDRSNKALDRVIEIVGAIHNGEGTLGRLVRDNTLYEALVLTVRRLGEAAGELRVLVLNWQEEGMRMQW